MRNIFIVRHGQTVANLTKALDTYLPGSPLTELGTQQAYAVGETLARRSSAASIFSSEAQRACDSADYLREAFKKSGSQILDWSFPEEAQASLITDSYIIPADNGSIRGIQEINAGTVEMREDLEAHKTYQGTILQWALGDKELLMPGGESGSATLERFLRGILSAALCAPQDVIVVSHGAMMRYGCSWLGGYSTIDVARSVDIRNSTFIHGELPSPQRCQELLSLTGEEFLTAAQGCIPITEWVGVPVTTPTHADDGRRSQNDDQSHE